MVALFTWYAVEVLQQLTNVRSEGLAIWTAYSWMMIVFAAGRAIVGLILIATLVRFSLVARRDVSLDDMHFARASHLAWWMIAISADYSATVKTAESFIIAFMNGGLSFM